MGWFRNDGRNDGRERIAALEAEVASLKQRVVRAEQTVSDLAERAYKSMKKAEARARRELDESGAGEPVGREGSTSATPSSSRRVRVWGARGRIARRGRIENRSDPRLELVEDTGS